MSATGYAIIAGMNAAAIILGALYIRASLRAVPKPVIARREDRRYEVTGRGYLPSDGSLWDGQGRGQFVRSRWLAELLCWSRHVEFPSSAHPCWKWNVYDHKRGRWLFDEH